MAEHVAAGTSYAEVKAAYDLCSAGDILSIPSGSSTWTTTLSVTIGITIRGAGVGGTVITNGGTDGVYEELIYYNPADYDLNSAFRITGCEFDANGYYTLRLGAANKAAPFALQTKIRIDHNKFGNSGSGKGFAIWNCGTLYGVVDNNEFVGGYPIANEYGLSVANGDTWFANEPQSTFTYGSAYYLYFEDNVFNLGSTFGESGDNTLMNGQNAVRYVFRYNTVTNGMDTYSLLELHGQQEAATACFGAEIYGNNIDCGANDLTLFKQRSGQTVVFLNNATTSGSPDNTAYTSLLCVCPENYADEKVTHNSYWFGNRKNLAGALFGASATGGLDCNGLEDIPTLGRDVFSDGSTPAVTMGTLAARPATCSVGQGYWATDQSTSNLENMVGAHPATPISGTFYRCDVENTWTEVFTPYTYPHPLQTGTAYYVDYDAADDTGNGTSDATPWKYCPGDSRADAAHLLSGGDTVYFKKGVTYAGHIDTVAGGVTYTTTTWGTGVAVIDGTGTAACIDVSHGDCTITGGTAETLKLTGADIKAAVHVYNATSGVNGLTVSYCTFEDIGTSGTQERIGLKVGGSEDEYQNISISYCTFSNVVYYAIKISGNPTHDIAIHHNTITNCGSAGGCQINVSQSGTTGAGIYDCAIYSNTIHTGAGTSGGINVLNPGVSVYGNTIYGHTAHGILLTFQAYAQEGAALVYKNLIRDNAGVGIKINYTTAAKHCHVYRNLVLRNGSDADISINTYADANEVYNNSIYSDAGVGTAAIWCSVSSNQNVIKNNAVYSEAKPCLLEASGDTVEDYNVFYRPSSATVSYGGTAYTDLATYRTAKSQGAHSVWSDPVFANPANNNMTIAAGSPCVDAGMDSSAVAGSTDYAGAAIDATCDVGAYEYVAGVDPPGYHVIYIAPGATSGSVPVDETEYSETDPVTVAANTGTLVRTGYSFEGWNEAADGSGANHLPGAAVAMPASDLVLYARWIEKCVAIASS